METKAPSSSVIFAFACLVLGSAYIAAVTFLPFPPENKNIVDMCVGWVIGTMLSGSIGYAIGTSVSSAKKDKGILTMAEGKGE